MKNSIVVVLVLVFILIGVLGGYYFYNNYLLEDNSNKAEKISNLVTNETKNEVVEKKDEEKTDVNKKGEFKKLTSLDFAILKMDNKNEENSKSNIIYSPLSIKYALKMLELGSEGNSKKEIQDILLDKYLTTYDNNENLTLANALFINDNVKDSIKDSYVSMLKKDFNAEVKFDAFEDTKAINDWVGNNTLHLLDNILDSVDPNTTFMLINALAIDLDWNEKFLVRHGEYFEYPHEDFFLSSEDNVIPYEFKNIKGHITGMGIDASINKYDIFKDLGEEKIRETIVNEFKKFVEEYKDDTSMLETYGLNVDYKDEDLEKSGNKVADDFIKELKPNYNVCHNSTEFSFYTDDDVKVFAKDLKEVDGTILQYIGVMPNNTNIDKYIENLDEEKIQNYIDNLKNNNNPNDFEDGYMYDIHGFIPKFKFEYTTKLMEDLQTLGVKDVFDQEKADLSNIIDDKNFINTVIHKANIEFTQDGIKASAVTILGGAGAGGYFDYLFPIPVKKIDLTFDKPYIFLIRDKETGEVWFVGKVVEPWAWKDEPEINNEGYGRVFDFDY